MNPGRERACGTGREPGTQRKGGWGGGAQVAKRLECQGEGSVLDSVGVASLGAEKARDQSLRKRNLAEVEAESSGAGGSDPGGRPQWC